MRYFYALLLLALGLSRSVHAQQPFLKYGVRVKVATLSNGRFQEFFTNDSLRRIGSVVYDTRLRRVAYLLPPDSLVGHAKPDITSRWMSPDPLAEKFMYISPYAYGNNNPVRYMDPDGREIVDSKGKHVQVDYNKNGTVRSISPNATPDERKVINALNLTSTGRAQLRAADKSDIQVAFSLVGGKPPKDKSGSVVLGNTTRPDPEYDGKNGKQIAIFTGAINESRGEGKKEGELKGLTMEQAIGAVASHEIVHAVDKKEIAKDLQNINRPDRETKPNQVERKVIEESKRLNQ
ncbi:RHS repeat-associated core domain-containing protein [Hymenobacter rubripertinctus]|uniref:RHS repeat-associated core domain-containing protein n=1 Tax=Hymenobacter rubripertinctus TaxID=2029981 RepID=A0A418QIS6_9BACT|nr:hypothetical protein [Hymenobacter rubripertinctus]RIY05086.1 hypothetical protein D0T11_21045 [Hymenobacter rubripertinctus]